MNYEVVLRAFERQRAEREEREAAEAYADGNPISAHEQNKYRKLLSWRNILKSRGGVRPRHENPRQCR
jgi:hypothetical protein